MGSARKRKQDKIEIICTIQTNFVIPFRGTGNVATEYNLHRFLINHVNFHAFCTGMLNVNGIEVMCSDMEKMGGKRGKIEPEF